MTPGLAGPPFPVGAIKDAVVAIASLENPSVPLAVGVCDIDVSSLQAARGGKGCAVQTVHWFGDELWDWSTTGKPGAAAPEALHGWIQEADKAALAEETNDMHLDDDDDDGEGGVLLQGGNAPTALTRSDQLRDMINGEDAVGEIVDLDEAAGGEMLQQGE